MKKLIVILAMVALMFVGCDKETPTFTYAHSETGVSYFGNTGHSATSPYHPITSAVSEPYSERYMVTSTGRKAKITTEDGFFTIDRLEPGESVEIEYHMEFDKEAIE